MAKVLRFLIQYQMNYKTICIVNTWFVVAEGISSQTMQPQSQKQDSKVFKLA